MSRKTARKDALARTRDERKFHEKMLLSATSRWKLRPADINFLEKLLFGRPGSRPLMCNVHARQITIEAMVDTLLESFPRRDRANLYFVTFCLDAGFTWEDAPQADLVAMKAKAARTLRRIGVQGFGTVEVDILH